ncbi:SOS response-associated peptidase [Geminicoccaceae bacterium 1502E]|nr:SOS response-associated peptidase [Geminicoccaceae bacterium 1502E]
MCGRFALSVTPAQFHALFGVPLPEGFRASWNITPDAQIVSLRAGRDGEPEALFMRWGMLGPWMKEAADRGRQINARAETAAEKPMFRASFRKGRCLIPADGFYEWQKQESGPSRPFYITRRDGGPVAFAGLWRVNRLADGELLTSCAILTTAASPAIRPLHHRMPVMLPEQAFAAWLDPGLEDPALLGELLEPLPDEALAAWEVERRVNSPRNDDPGLTAPAGTSSGGEEEQEPPAKRQGSLF